MIKNILFLISSISIFNSSYAQQNDSLVFDGHLSVHKADHYKYKLVLGEKDGKWQGYSVLDAKGPNETKSSVGVQFSKEKKALIFAEKALIASKSKENTFCFVGGVLKMNGKGTEVKGFFLGQDEKKKMCGSGTVRFSIPERARVLMTPDGTRDTNISAIVTNKKSETIKVINAEVTLEIWDGGINDQDSLSIIFNQKELLAPFQIQNEKRTVKLVLQQGMNEVKIKALNEGSQPPNSARFLLIDGNMRYPVVSFLQKGEEAIIKINR